MLLGVLLTTLACFGSSDALVKMSIYPPNRVVLLKTNDNLTLTCKVYNKEHVNKTYDISWILPIKLSNILSRVNFSKNNGNTLVLSVTKLQKNDSGTYLCEVRDDEDMLLSQKISVVVQAENCLPPFFECGRSCIAPHYVCDGHRDCHDGSDEFLKNCVALQSSEAPLQYNFHSLGFYHSTVYTMINCAIAFVFMSTILLIAICRIRMQRNSRFLRSSQSSQRSRFWYRPPSQQMGGTLPLPNGPHDPSDPSENFVLLRYDSHTGFELADCGPKPPPYTESLMGVPPPPYSSKNDLTVNEFPQEQQQHFQQQSPPRTDEHQTL